MPSTKKVRARLLEAIDEQRIVRVERTPRFADRLDGFVVQVGEKWVLMAQSSDGGFFNGYVAFRIRDVRRLRSDRTFETTFAMFQPEWPPTYPSDLDTSSTGGLLQGLGRDGVLVAIQKDHERSAMWIGKLVEIKKGRVYINEVRPDATWHPEPFGYKLKAITTVEIGTRYLIGLAAVAATNSTPE